MRVALISDTHDLLRPEALEQLRGCDHIVHAGDVCGAPLLAALEAVAPVTAVRGNNDRGAWAESLRAAELRRLGEILVYVVHDLADVDLDPLAAGVQVVVYGHSHRPRVERRDGVLYVNPGSAGPRRFKLPVTMGELVIHGDTVTPRIIELAIHR
jgi:putative phosphoesterase